MASVLADGRVSVSATSGGVVVRELTGDDVVAGRAVRRYPNIGRVDVVVPFAEVAIWQVSCACGWTGSERPAGAEHGADDCPESLKDSWAAPEWEAHIAPFVALTDLTRLVDQQRDLAARVADTVGLARAAGASWAQVGRAAGMSKQGAQQRWSRLASGPEAAAAE